jgi:hypothetical protein
MEAVVVVGDMAGVEEAAGTAVAAMAVGVAAGVVVAIDGAAAAAAADAVGMTMPGTIERLVLPWE